MRPGNLNGYLIKSTVVAALGGLLFGFDTAVIAGATRALTELTISRPPPWAGPYRARCGAPSWARCSPVSPGTATAAATACGAWPFCTCLLARLRARLGLVFAAVLPLHRRARHRRLVGAGAHVYRRDRAAEVARPAGGLLPVQRGVRHSAGLPVELPDRDRRLRGHRVALEAGSRGVAGGGILPDAVHDSTQPALAGEEAAHCRSQRRAAHDRRGRL